MTTLTEQMLRDMPPGEFATGVAMDNAKGLFMANTGRVLRWVAVRGEIHDWAIYCHFAKEDAMWVAKHGDKVCRENHIKQCVPCDDAAFALYRR